MVWGLGFLGGLAQSTHSLFPQDIIAILGMDELSEEDKLTVARARKAPSAHGPFFVASGFVVKALKTNYST